MADFDYLLSKGFTHVDFITEDKMYLNIKIQKIYKEIKSDRSVNFLLDAFIESDEKLIDYIDKESNKMLCKYIDPTGIIVWMYEFDAYSIDMKDIDIKYVENFNNIKVLPVNFEIALIARNFKIIDF